LLSQHSAGSSVGPGSSNGGTTAAAAAAAAATLNGTPQLPVGAEYVGPGEEPVQLTKAQKKNLKRAEKKKKTGHPEINEGGSSNAGTEGEVAALGDLSGMAPGGSSSSVGTAPAAAAAAAAAGSEDGSGVDAAAAAAAAAAGGGGVSSRRRQGKQGAAATAAAAACASGSSRLLMSSTRYNANDDELVDAMYELAVQALLAHKTLALVTSLQRIGFKEWQAAAAVQRHGSQLEEAVAWLLDDGAPDAAAAAAAISGGCVADVSIREELALLQQLVGAVPGVPRSKVYQAVADSGGDLDLAAATCLQQAAVAGAAAAADVNDNDFDTSELHNTSMTPLAADAAATWHQPQQQAALDLTRNHDPLLLLPNGLDHVGSSSRAVMDAFAQDPVSHDLAATSSQSFTAWLGDRGSSSSSKEPAAAPPHQQQHQQQQQQQQQVPLDGRSPFERLSAAEHAGNGSSLVLLPGSGLGDYSAAGIGSSIWANGATAAAAAAAGAGTTSWNMDSRLFSSGSLGLQGTLGGLGLGGYGSSSSTTQQEVSLFSGSSQPLQQQQQQQSLSASDPVLETFASGAGASSSSTLDVSSLGVTDPTHNATAAAAAAAAHGLQQSRLFSSYGGWRQQPLFASGDQQQQQQQQPGANGNPTATATAAAAAVPADGAIDADETDLEGLMATLMCH
jgi:hypothetical protein